MIPAIAGSGVRKSNRSRSIPSVDAGPITVAGVGLLEAGCESPTHCKPFSDRNRTKASFGRE